MIPLCPKIDVCLPAEHAFLLPASKAVPSTAVEEETRWAQQRNSIGHQLCDLETELQETPLAVTPRKKCQASAADTAQDWPFLIARLGEISSEPLTTELQPQVQTACTLR
mmetsp:Transcript_43531/g.114898  ORF Transcript_43531/g.114898 Transcript_43531/m.114898 type:complete len:110 (-) Transcript_43531:349-678(-)